MIGKFTEWLLENTDLLNEKICSGAGTWPIIELKDIGTEVTDVELKKAIAFIINNIPKNKVQFIKLNPNNTTVNEIYIAVDANKRSTTHEDRKKLYEIFFENTGIKEDSDEKSFLFKGCKYISLDKNFLEKLDYQIEFEGKLKQYGNNLKDVITGDQNSAVNFGSYYIKNGIIYIDNIFKFKFEPSGMTVNSDYIKSTIKYANVLLDKLENKTISTVEIDNLRKTILNNIKSIKSPYIEYEIYEKLLGKYNSSVNTSDFYTEKYKLSNGKTLGETLYNSDIMTVASEILIPYMLLAGVKTIDGNDIIKAFAGESKNKTVQAIKYPESNTNFFADYSVVFVKDNKTNDIEEYKVSSKTGAGNAMSLYTLYRKHPEQFEGATGLLKEIINYCKNKKLIISKFVWIAGAIAKGMSYEQIDSLLKIHDKLIEELPNKNIFNELNKLGIKGKELPYPYSLTDYFNKIACDALNKDKDAKDIVLKIIFGNEENVQIYITPMAKNFNIKIVSNKKEKRPTLTFKKGSSSPGTDKFKNKKSLEDIGLLALNNQLKYANANGSMLGLQFE